ncbi:hypothetical protein EC07798_1270 [Escherichia coli 07798]|nr:hypothetical protein EC07798_1270 [Escherichia coli 07798]
MTAFSILPHHMKILSADNNFDQPIQLASPAMPLSGAVMLL